ncbi:GlxA family transcriptional regulator [Phenylobacterium sp.]|jgi:transcriptional regulator GlxA family with amidase domain|uniref:GlxA family transcriptional regulator n=1 Tax=Phenylobacterium sp. TaxID=1871053 RepID=UPI002F92A292
MPVRAVTFLVFEGFQLLDVSGPAAVFEVSAQFGGAYEVSLASVAGGPVRSSCGFVLHTGVFEPGFGTLVVPGGDTVREGLRDEAFLAAIRKASVQGQRVASVCSGAFILAAAGVLDGRRAATHWAAAADLRRRHPGVRVDADSIFVEDAGVWTSAGVTAGIDLALAMVARDHSDAVARRVAQQLVVYYRRPGAQSQHSALLDLVTPDNRFAPVLQWARERLAEPLPVERLAERAALSPRQFTRAFTAATGMAPAKAVERLRVETARSAIEAGARSLDEVARRTGFGSAQRMRRSFVKLTGQPPSYRRVRSREEA